MKICQTMVRKLEYQRRSFQPGSVRLIASLEVAMARDFSAAISDQKKGSGRVLYRKLLSFIFTVRNLVSYSLHLLARDQGRSIKIHDLPVCSDVEQADFRRIHHFGGTKFEKFRERFDLFLDEDSPHERGKIQNRRKDRWFPKVWQLEDECWKDTRACSSILSNRAVNEEIAKRYCSVDHGNENAVPTNRPKKVVGTAGKGTSRELSIRHASNLALLPDSLWRNFARFTGPMRSENLPYRVNAVGKLRD